MAVTPLLSIIIPVYSGEKYLKKCLSSLLNQKCDEEYEIVLSINLDAEEECKKLCEKAIKMDSHFVSVTMKEENLAKAICRLEGVKFSKGKYITFVDNDDYYSSDKAIESIITEIKKHGADITIFPYFYAKNGKERLAFAQNFKAKVLKKEEAFDKLNKDFSMPHFLWNKAFKRELFDSPLMIFSKKEDMFEDCVLVTSLYLNASSFYRSSYPYYCYVIDNPDADTKIKRTNRAFYHLCVYASERAYLEKYHPTYLKYWKKAYHRHISFIIYDSLCDKKNGDGRLFHNLRQLNVLHKKRWDSEELDSHEVVERTLKKQEDELLV